MRYKLTLHLQKLPQIIHIVQFFVYCQIYDACGPVLQSSNKSREIKKIMSLANILCINWSSIFFKP
jgi:hypothetical protein